MITHLHLVSRTRMVEPYSNPPYVCMAWCSIKKQRDNFALTFYRHMCVCVYHRYVMCERERHDYIQNVSLKTRREEATV
jgi:hypothetical protein